MNRLRRIRALRLAGRGRGWLVAAALALVVSAVFKPTVVWQRPRFEHVVVLDVTQSMNVADMRLDGAPASRLAYAKHALRAALLQLPCGSKVGWAIFTEYRSFLLLAPLEVCAHLDELRASLAQIGTPMAWAGNSEIAKGVHSALGIAKALPGTPSLVFITDGQEAPPLSPRFRPSFDDKPGEVAGLIVGVGDTRPVPIPKLDPAGRPLGFWRADEVMQTDPRAQGRGGSVQSETMADDGAVHGTPTAAGASLGATPGTEHLSALREGYLRLLAGEQGLGYLRLDATPGLAVAWRAPAFERLAPAEVDARVALAVVALLALLAHYAVPWLRRTPRDA